MFKSLVDFSWNAPLAAAATVFFFVLFIAVIVWTMFLKKKYIREMENLPLQSDEETTTAHKDQE